MVVCTTYIMLGLACLATALSLIQEGLMLKAERMKNKMGLGKAAKVRFDEVMVRGRVSRDSSGYFIGLDTGPDSEDPVTSVGDPTDEVSRISRRIRRREKLFLAVKGTFMFTWNQFSPKLPGCEHRQSPPLSAELRILCNLLKL